MAKDDRDEEKTEQEQPAKGKGSMMKWIIIIGIVVLVLGGGAGGAYYYFVKMAAPKKEAAQQKPPIGALWAMEPFIVNLIDNEGQRYLKAVIQLEVSDPLTVAELDQIKPKIRDNILDLLSAKSYKDLMETGGKQRLREEIQMRVNSYLTKGKVEKVYFLDFVIQ
jgi:flagellar FliL protein